MSVDRPARAQAGRRDDFVGGPTRRAAPARGSLMMIRVAAAAAGTAEAGDAAAEPARALAGPRPSRLALECSHR